jgi:hypothetical protein
MSADTKAADGTTDAVADVAELDDRDIRALIETMTVLDERAPAPADADGLYHVTTASGSSYVVEPALGACDCPDAEQRAPAGGCKHVRRVRFEVGTRPLPETLNEAAIDDQFRQFVSEDTNE